MRTFVLIVLLGLCSMAQAKPQILSFKMPTVDCDGLVLAQSDLIESNLIYDIVPMPMPSDSAGPCAQTADPGPPAGATVVPIPVTDTTVILNLKPGEHYFARMNVSAYLAGNWSAWSVQYEFTVPYGRPDRVVIADNGVQFISYMIDDPVIRLD